MGVYFSHTRKTFFPYEYVTIRYDTKGAGVDVKMLAGLDKLADK